MAARPRKTGSKDLPQYLYRKGEGYLYKHPKAPKSKFIRERHKAINFAISANKAMDNQLKSKAVKSLRYPNSPLISQLIARFENEYLPRLKLKATTLKARQSLLKRFHNDLGDKHLAEINQESLSKYLDNGFTGDGYVKARALMVHIYKYAMSKGWADNNLAQNTLTGEKSVKVTKPHTKEGFDAIYSEAVSWMQDMMIFGKCTLLRPDDLRNLKRSDVDMDKRTVKVAIRKTSNYKEAVFLEIYLDDLLPGAFEVVQRRMTNPIASPYLFCYKPKRVSKAVLASKEHWSYITKGVASKAFRVARDKSGAYSELSVPERPTLKEIRNFGAQIYKEKGYPEAFIQKLMGHKDFTTTQIYLDDGQQRFDEVRL